MRLLLLLLLPFLLFLLLPFLLFLFLILLFLLHFLLMSSTITTSILFCFEVTKLTIILKIILIRSIL